jgi:hypothetical protein
MDPAAVFRAALSHIEKSEPFDIEAGRQKILDFLESPFSLPTSDVTSTGDGPSIYGPNHSQVSDPFTWREHPGDSQLPFTD